MAGARTPSDDDDIIPLADATLMCKVCGTSFLPVSGEETCPACTHIAPKDLPEERIEGNPDAECPSCGYSLRGLPPGSGCPECGHGAPRPVSNPFRSKSTAPRFEKRASPAESAIAAPPLRRPARRDVERDDLVARGYVASAAVGLLVLGAGLCALGSALLAVSHWWAPWLLNDWSPVIGWVLFSTAAILLSVKGSLPRRRVSRWFTTMALGGGLATGAALAGYPLTSGIGGVALAALLDLVSIVAACAFLIGLSARINAITEFTGQDPSERGFLASSGPFIAGVFIIAIGHLLTWFFRRKLDFSDSFALAVAVWMMWRLGAILWHTKNAALERSQAEVREGRRRQRGPGGDDVELPSVCCAHCGHALRGLPRHSKCPECGSHERT
jgi:rubrerythrin